MSTKTTTHYADYDALRSLRMQRAVCGAWVDTDDLSMDPTCTPCAASKAAADGMDFGEWDQDVEESREVDLAIEIKRDDEP